MDFIQIVTKYSNQIYAHGAKPELQKAFLDSLSPGQVFSKLGVIEIFKKQNLDFGSCLFVGQWHGILPLMMFQEGLIKSGVGIELSETWSSISYQLNKEWNWKSIQGNINDSKVWERQNPELIVNTSSEHMAFDWLQFVQKNTHVLLQSTNFQIPEHCNSVSSVDELIEKSRLSNIIEHAEQDFGIYKRYTVLGQK